jgi:hypothetical protein
VSRLAAGGVSVEVPVGWEAEFRELERGNGEARRLQLHLANFALPSERGDYGSGAVERMDSGAVLVILTEFDPGSADRRLFAGEGVPRRLGAGDFSPEGLQRRLPGQAGAQRWFRVGARAFGLYVVLGSGRAATLLAPEVTRVLAGLEIG